MLNSPSFEVNEHKTFQDTVIKNEVNMIMNISNCEWILTTNKSKAFTQFQKERLHIVNQSLLQFAFLIILLSRNAKEFKGVSILNNIFRL